MNTRLIARMLVLSLMVVMLWGASHVSADGPTPTAPDAAVDPQAAPIDAPTVIGPNEKFTIRATELLCLDAEESANNEPYVILGFSQPNGQLGSRLSFLNTSVFSGVRAGDTRQMNLTLLNNQHLARSVDIVALVMEHDSTPTSEVLEQTQFHAKVHYNFALLNGETSNAALRSAVAKGFGEGARAIIISGRDDDEALGPGVVSVSATDLDNLVAGESRTRTVEVTGSGGRFRLTFVITRNS